MAGNLQLQLGSVHFLDFEIPESFPVGGTQSIAVREFPGGRKTIQTFGPFPRLIQWSGKLFGTDAFARYVVIDQLRSKGDQQTLTYGPFEYKGVIKTFNADVKFQWMVDYEIEFEVAEDLSAGAIQAPDLLPIEPILTNASNQLAVPPAVNDPTGTIAQGVVDFKKDLNRTLGLSGGTVGGMTDDDVKRLTGQLDNIQMDIQQQLDGLRADNVDDLVKMASLKQFDLDLKSINSMFDVDEQRIFTESKVITAVNPDLFAIAGNEYGDPSKWDIIAKANGLFDPQPTGPYSLLIPPLTLNPPGLFDQS